MSNQIVISSGAKVRALEGVLTGTAGIVNALGINVPSGIPQLDGSGKILVSQLPNSVMEYKGTWNAATNTPTLVNGTGNQGDVYLCNVAGTTDFGAGPITFFVGDQVIYSGAIWQRASGATGTVTSVAVTESGDALTITGSPITTSGTINIGFAGVSGQYINGAGGLTTFPTLISSIGLSMPSAFNVANSPLTANGTIAVTGAGVASQYIRGDGTLANFPTSGGGGSSVSYYLNGSINQGTIGGVTYYEMNKVPVIGAGTDFSRGSNGYIASFLTDANDPALLEIPAGNWNFETYLSASSGGGSPTYYIELYKYDGTTFTLIASNSAFPKLINDGTSIEAYFSALAVPQTSLTLTDRLAVRIYVTTAGRTITLHTENSHLCQVITTFSTGLTALNGLTAQVQYFGTGTSGTDFNIASSVATHTFNLPIASAINTGKLSSTDWSTFNNKLSTATAAATYVPYTGANSNVALGAFSMSLTTLAVNNIAANNNGTDDIGAAGAGNKFRNVYANSFVKTSGTSSQFLKADGSVDSTAYLPLGGGTLTGNLIGTFIFAKDQFTTTKNSVSGSSAFYGFQTAAGVNRWNFAITDLETGSNAGFNFNIDRYADNGTLLGTSLSINRATNVVTIIGKLSTAEIGCNQILANNNGTDDIGTSGGNTFRNIYANSFVKTGGTSAQYLKADGSTSTLTNPITGTGTAGTIALFTASGTIGNSTIVEGEGGVSINNYLFSGLPYFSYDTSLAASFRITSNTNGNQVKLAFGTVSGVNNYSNIVTTIVDNSADTKGRLDFQVRNGNNSYATPLVLVHTGQVGIGVSSPTGLLNIYGGTGNAAAIFTIQSSTGGGGNSGIYFRPYQTEGQANANPAQAAITAEDDNYSSSIKFLTKTSGALANSLVERMRISAGGVIKINGFTSNGLVGTDASGNLGIVNSTYTEIATGTITYSMMPTAWGINNSFPANIRNYADDLIAGTTGADAGSNENRGVVFDLGSSKAVRRIVERGYNVNCLNALTVQYSSDNSNWTTIFVYPHVYGNTQKEMNFNPTGAISARYWRWFISSWTQRDVTNYYTYESIIYT